MIKVSHNECFIRADYKLFFNSAEVVNVRNKTITTVSGSNNSLNHAKIMNMIENDEGSGGLESIT